MAQPFLEFFDQTYGSISDGIAFGRPQKNKTYTAEEVVVPLERMTQHGLIAGSTGTGKSRAAQILIEGLRANGVPVLIGDVKGDMSGLSLAAEGSSMLDRAKELKYSYQAKSFDVRYWGSVENHIPIRFSLHQVHYVLVAKLLNLNQVQESHLGAIYRYAEKHNNQLSSLNHLVQLCEFFIKYPENEVGVSTSSVKVIMRNTQNALDTNIGDFFGEPQLDTQDLLKNITNIISLDNIQQDNFNIGSLFAILLNKIYTDLNEVKESAKPKLMVFIDEAHQLFDQANPHFVKLMSGVIKRIRSKGVGVIFISQDSDDIPEDIREQCSMKIQFALRSFGGKDLQQVKGIMKSFPATEQYNLAEDVKSLAAGECFISILNQKGRLLSPIKVVVYPPASSSAPLEQAKFADLLDEELVTKYKLKADLGLDLGTPLNSIKTTSGSNWGYKQDRIVKENRRVRREVNRRNKQIKSYVYLFLASLGLIAVILLLIVLLKLV